MRPNMQQLKTVDSSTQALFMTMIYYQRQQKSAVEFESETKITNKSTHKMMELNSHARTRVFAKCSMGFLNTHTDKRMTKTQNL